MVKVISVQTVEGPVNDWPGYYKAWTKLGQFEFQIQRLEQNVFQKDIGA